MRRPHLETQLSDPTNLLWLGLGIAIGGYGIHLIRYSARVVDAVIAAHRPNSKLGDLLAQVPRQPDRRGRHAVRRR